VSEGEGSKKWRGMARDEKSKGNCSKKERKKITNPLWDNLKYHPQGVKKKNDYEGGPSKNIKGIKTNKKENRKRVMF